MAWVRKGEWTIVASILEDAARTFINKQKAPDQTLLQPKLWLASTCAC